MSRTRLLESMRRLDVPGVAKLLDRQPALLKFVDARGKNLLHLACSVDSKARGLPAQAAVRLVGDLLGRGMDPDSPFRTREGEDLNPVWFAVALGRNPGVVRLLLKRGARPIGLFAAGWYEDLPMLRLLLEAGANIDEQAEDETPFLHCWKAGRFKAARLLLRAGANVNFQDSKGRTALHHSLNRDFQPTLLRELMKAGASPDLVDAEGVSARTRAGRKRDRRYRKALA